MKKKRNIQQSNGYRIINTRSLKKIIPGVLTGGKYNDSKLKGVVVTQRGSTNY